MLFHSWVFLLFFAVFYPVFLLTKHTRLKDPWLLFCSYVFYGWWNPLYLALIAWSTTVDYSHGHPHGQVQSARGSGCR